MCQIWVWIKTFGLPIFGSNGSYMDNPCQICFLFGFDLKCIFEFLEGATLIGWFAKCFFNMKNENGQGGKG
jgi:hypothetical protein